MANASLARFSTPSGVALRHHNSRRTSTTTYNQRLQSVSLPEAPNSGEPLPALFPNSGEPLQSMQSEETVTVAWERNIRHLHHIAAPLTTCPADLPVKPNQELPAAQSAYHTHHATQESVFCLACHLRFHTEHAIQAPPSQLERGRQKRCGRRFTRTYAHTDIIKHQLKVYSTHVCPSVLEAPCSHPESCTRCTYVGKKCDIASTSLPW